jgi:hypothetical protein
MESVIAFIVANKVVILAFLFAFSELLGLIPSVKSSSVFQLVYNVIKKAVGK